MSAERITSFNPGQLLTHIAHRVFFADALLPPVTVCPEFMRHQATVVLVSR